MKRFFFSFLVLSCLFSEEALGGGSVNFNSDIRPLLERSFDINRVASGFSINQEGQAQRISYHASPALVGSRIGPYIFRARGIAYMEYELTFLTDIDFYGRDGELLLHVQGDEWNSNADISEAMFFVENITGVSLQLKPSTEVKKQSKLLSEPAPVRKDRAQGMINRENKSAGQAANQIVLQ